MRRQPPPCPAPRPRTLLPRYPQPSSRPCICNSPLHSNDGSWLTNSGLVEFTLAPPSLGTGSQVRAAILEGDINGAIDALNDVNPELLDSDSSLYFSLQRQQMIELIKQNRITEALEFAQTELAPLAGESELYLNQLDDCMALLALHQVPDCRVAHLLSQGQRQKVARELNTALLRSQHLQAEPRLPNLLRLMVWAQTRLKAHKDASFVELTLRGIPAQPAEAGSMDTSEHQAGAHITEPE
eukprot:m.102201 g.102201  ORF g.102201 m.102201 type:complete len:241 (+) comp51531_c0_seq7:104-826(+)